MKALLVAVLAASTAASTIAIPAAQAQEFKFGLLTGTLPNTQLIAANVVREPAFVGEPSERDQAISEAEPALNRDYCGKAGQQFVVDPGLVVFDKGYGEWMVGGICR